MAVSPTALACSTCGAIPDLITVDTLHHPDSFPAEAARLEVVSGPRWDQLRRCPACGAHFAYTWDHDSQSGVGYGYTDERLERLFWFEPRGDGALTLRNASTRVTGDMLAAFIRDVASTGRPPLDRISALVIAARNFGDAPAELGDLEMLDLVQFSESGLTSLPPTIGRLTRLANLWIAGNPLSALPLELAGLPALARVELQNTGIVSLPAPLVESPIEFLYYEANEVPRAWRPVYVREYRNALRWLADRGGAIVEWASGAWTHEDRYHLVVRLPAAAAADLRRANLAPFALEEDHGSRLVLSAAGRAGRDRIVVEIAG